VVHDACSVFPAKSFRDAAFAQRFSNLVMKLSADLEADARYYAKGTGCCVRLARLRVPCLRSALIIYSLPSPEGGPTIAMKTIAS
jgi:hypothetical protein